MNDPSPTQEVEVQRFLWEADQLSYEPPGSGPKEDGAERLAPLGEYVRFEDYQADCERCHGTGWSREGGGFVPSPTKCPACNGSGFSTQQSTTGKEDCER